MLGLFEFCAGVSLAAGSVAAALFARAAMDDDAPVVCLDASDEFPITGVELFEERTHHTMPVFVSIGHVIVPINKSTADTDEHCVFSAFAASAPGGPTGGPTGGPVLGCRPIGGLESSRSESQSGWLYAHNDVCELLGRVRTHASSFCCKLPLRAQVYTIPRPLFATADFIGVNRRQVVRWTRLAVHGPPIAASVALCAVGAGGAWLVGSRNY
jgi:hypothetical protein